MPSPAGEATLFMRPGVLLVPSMCTDANLRLVRQCGATDIVLTCPGFTLGSLQAAVQQCRAHGDPRELLQRRRGRLAESRNRSRKIKYSQKLGTECGSHNAGPWELESKVPDIYMKKQGAGIKVEVKS